MVSSLTNQDFRDQKVKGNVYILRRHIADQKLEVNKSPGIENRRSSRKY